MQSETNESPKTDLSRPLADEALRGEMQIVESELITHQYRVPRTKKRRIRNKWAKRPENYSPYRGVIHDERLNTLYCHPMVARRLREQARKAR